MEAQMNPGTAKERRTNLLSYMTEQKDLICLPSDATLAEAARLMRQNHVGNVIAVEEQDGKPIPVGIITDRDIALGSDVQNLEECMLSDIMSKSLATARVGDDLLEMVRVMKESGVTRLPLVDEAGTLAGIVTAKKLLQVLVRGLSDLTQISERQKENEKQTRH